MENKMIVFSRQSITGFNQSKLSQPCPPWMKIRKSQAKAGRFNHESQTITIRKMFYKLNL